MLTKIDRSKILLLFILLLAAILRFVKISEVPPALNWDELSHGYNAYSILTTGKDEWGVSFPTIFRAFGDYKLPVYIYATVIPVALWGITELSVRLVSILAGTFLVLFSYLLTFEIFNKSTSERHVENASNMAILTALLVAIEPWTFFLSRGAFEANLALALFTGGMYFFLRGLSRPLLFIFSALFLGLSVWTYNSYRIFTPLMVVACSFIFRDELKKVLRQSVKTVSISGLILFVLLGTMFFQLLSPTGQARFSRVTILDEGAIANIEGSRAAANFSPGIEKLLYNKGTYILRRTIINWGTNYSLDFLYFSGGDQYQYNVPDRGILYLTDLPFLFIGLVVVGLGVVQKNKFAKLAILWILFAPLPSSVTRDVPHTLRVVTFLPIPMLLSAVGLITFFSVIKRFTQMTKFVLLGLYLVILFASAEMYMDKYFNDYPNKYSWSWQYGYEEAVTYIKGNYEEFDKIIVTKKYGEPHLFILGFWPWDAESYRSDTNLNRFKQTDWYWVDRFDKFYFVNDWDIPIRSDLDFSLESGEVFDCDKTNCLLITSPDNHPPDWQLVKTINFLDDSKAFEIYETKHQ